MNSKQIPLDNFVENSQSALETHIIYFGDIRSSLLHLKDESIDVAITSPPYWNQRDYGFEGQIGNESSIEDYITKLTVVFSILREKLGPQGVFYLNIGDKYLSKYGNTPLGMIPYKLAKSLIENGWLLQDTLIWFKPNHMPSSVKNRFTNTYEPVFVLVKNNNNYYKEFFQSSAYSNFIQIPLQQNTYKHIATFPENLIKSLLSKLTIPETAFVIDPFAGSGTTSFAVKDINKLVKSHYSSIAIEAKKQFVQIIQTRCNISVKNVKKIPFNSSPIRKEVKQVIGKIIIDKKQFTQSLVDYNSMDLRIKTFSPSEHSDVINIIDDNSFISSLRDSGILICNFSYLDPYLLVSLANSKNWIVRNVILRWENKIAFPMLLLVKDIKTIRYKFNLDAIREEHFGKDEMLWKTLNFKNIRVLKTTSLFKKTDEGFIKNILSTYENNFPKIVEVAWNSNKVTIEETLNFTGTNDSINFSCPSCKTRLSNYYRNRFEISCPKCGIGLWKNYETIPILSIQTETNPALNKIMLNSTKTVSNSKSNSKLNKKSEKKYKGKFKLDDRINMGQSPGARLSVTEQYFFVTRYYSIDHGLFAKYLNLLLKHLNITKQELINRFPTGYKHTIGHWFRYDMGGSLPKIEDLDLLEEKLAILIDPNYKTLISRTGIKYQSVLKDRLGKNPGDFLKISSQEIIGFFKKIVN